MVAKKLDRTQTFTVPSWTTKDHTIRHVPTGDSEPQRLIAEKAEVLETAKRRAITSFAKMNAAPDAGQQSTWAAATTRDEQDVLRARVDLLESLIQGEDLKLCLENTCDTKICVSYDRIRMDEAAELGPMQSTMTWVVPGAEIQVELIPMAALTDN